MTDAPAPSPAEEPSFERKLAHAICVAIQFKDFGKATDEGGWHCTGEQIRLLEQTSKDAVTAIKPLIAQQVVALEAENARLREALRQCKSWVMAGTDETQCGPVIVRFAKGVIRFVDDALANATEQQP